MTAQWGVTTENQLRRDLKAFGGNLRRERMAKKITQETLAERAELNIRTVQKIEAAECNVLITTAVRLRRAIGCSWDSLLER